MVPGWPGGGRNVPLLFSRLRGTQATGLYSVAESVMEVDATGEANMRDTHSLDFSDKRLYTAQTAAIVVTKVTVQEDGLRTLGFLA